ncbi:hypothetical protein BC831DRAFT_399457 [Entophlyctis helioformis]|nr:hypothetical protein BC831DRAFT_399457 [Entophlyctis helioformis]
MPIPPLAAFISTVARTTKISPAVILLPLVIFDRLKQALPPSARGMACTIHRIALSAMIISEKYLCDVPMKNRSWAAHSVLFSLDEVNLMERQLLHLLVSLCWACFSQLAWRSSAAC